MQFSNIITRVYTQVVKDMSLFCSQ